MNTSPAHPLAPAADECLTSDQKREAGYKDSWSAGLYNCTTGSNYLRNGEYHKLVEHLEAMQTAKAALVAVLWALTNEIGSLDAFETEIRYAISNTNWECLKRRASDGRAALVGMGLSDDDCRAIYRASLASVQS